MDDQEAMRRALALARSVEGRTSPRPPVGALVVRDDTIVGQGATAPPYGPHAEIHALAQAGTASQGSTLYVTLEPCCITVHTLPCTTAILAAGVRRVFVGAMDANPQVCGRGLAQLREAGVEVHVMGDSWFAREAAEIVRPFACAVTLGRAYVTAKWAMTLDGKLASPTGDSHWISGPDARSWVHDLRDRSDAILVGAETARKDDPRLTVRLLPEQQRWERTARPKPPLRVVLSTSGELPTHLALLQPDLASNTCIITSEETPSDVQQRLRERGVEVLTVAVDKHGRPDLHAALQALWQRGSMHVLLEGGARLLGSAFDGQCIDHVAAFVCPKLIGGSGAPSPLAGHGLANMDLARQLRYPRTTLFQNDVLIEGDLSYEREGES